MLKQLSCYWSELGSAQLWAVKPIYWHQIVVKKSTAFIAGHQASRWAVHAQKTQASQWLLGGRWLKTVWGRGLQDAWSALVHSSWIGWHQGELLGVTSLLVSTSLWSVSLRPAVFIWWESASCKSSLGMCVRPLFISFGELWVQWFCSMVNLESKSLAVSGLNSYSLFLYLHFCICISDLP